MILWSAGGTPSGFVPPTFQRNMNRRRRRFTYWPLILFFLGGK